MKIEKGVPIPDNYAQTRWPFGEMEVGDSFLVPEGAHRKVRNAASSFERTRVGVKFALRKIGEKEWRLWRTQ